MLTRKKNKQNRHRKTKRQDGGLFRGKEIEEFKTFVKTVVNEDTDDDYKELIDTLITKQKEWKAFETTKKAYSFNHVKYAFDKLKKDPEKLGKFMRIAHFHSSAPASAPAPASASGPAPASASAEDTKTLDLLYHYNEPFKKKKEHTIETIKELLQNCHKLCYLLEKHHVMTTNGGYSPYYAFIFETENENEKNIKTVSMLGKGNLRVIKSDRNIVLENQDQDQKKWNIIASVSLQTTVMSYNDPVINDKDIKIGQNLNYLRCELIEKACIELDNHFSNDLDVMDKFDRCITDYENIKKKLNNDTMIKIDYEHKTDSTAYANSLVKTRMFVTSEKVNANVASFVKSYTAAIEIMVSKMKSNDYVGCASKNYGGIQTMTANEFKNIKFCNPSTNLINADKNLSAYNQKSNIPLYTLVPPEIVHLNTATDIDKRKRAYALATNFIPLIYKLYNNDINTTLEAIKPLVIEYKTKNEFGLTDSDINPVSDELKQMCYANYDPNEVSRDGSVYLDANRYLEYISTNLDDVIKMFENLDNINTVNDQLPSVNENIWNKMYPDENERPDDFTKYVLTDAFKRSFFFLFITKDLSNDARTKAIVICKQIYNTEYNTKRLELFLTDLTTDVFKVLRDKIKKELTSKSRSTPSRVEFVVMTFLFESIVPFLVALLAEATIPGVGIVLALLIYKSKHTRSKLFSHLKYHISRKISDRDKKVLADPEVLFYMKLQNPDLYSYILTKNYTDSEQDSLTKFFGELEGFETKAAEIADDSQITSLGLPELQSKGGKGAGKKKKRGKKKRPAKIVVKKAFRD
jgi:hypothetical protein